MPPLLFVACAAGGLDEVAERAVRPLRAGGWSIQAVLTEHAEAWLRSSGGLDAFADAAGGPASSESAYPPHRPPTERPDAAVVAPATFNLVNKLAAGIADDRAITKLCELAAMRPARPIVILPRVNAAHTRHPAWPASLATLRGMAGVSVLDVPTHEPGEQAPPLGWEWDLLLDAVRLPSPGA